MAAWLARLLDGWQAEWLADLLAGWLASLLAGLLCRLCYLARRLVGWLGAGWVVVLHLV